VYNFASNSNKNLLEAMTIKDRSRNLKDCNLRHDILPVQKPSNKDGMFQNRHNAYNRNKTSVEAHPVDLTHLSTKENCYTV